MRLSILVGHDRGRRSSRALLREKAREPFHVEAASLGQDREPKARASRALHELALVGATYGLPYQTLGAVSLLGPLRMDYEKALRTVRSAAHELSRFVEEVYAED